MQVVDTCPMRSAVRAMAVGSASKRAVSSLPGTPSDGRLRVPSPPAPPAADGWPAIAPPAEVVGGFGDTRPAAASSPDSMRARSWGRGEGRRAAAWSSLPGALGSESTRCSTTVKGG
jgi:hypothetical protein